MLAEAADEWRKLVAVASLSGIANALIMYLVSALVSRPDSLDARQLFLFCLAIGMYAFGARYTYNRMGDLIESLVYRMRIRLIGKLERAELQGIERLGTTEIYGRLTENMATISTAGGMIAHLLQSMVIVVAGTLYLIWHSATAFAAIALLFTAGIGLYGSGVAGVREQLQILAHTRLVFLDSLTDLLKGFKEVKHSRKRMLQLSADIEAEALELRKRSSRVNHLLDNSWVFINCVLYVVLAALVMILPQHLHLNAEAMGKVVPAVLLTWGPLLGIVRGYGEYLRSNQALDEIEALEAKLDSFVEPSINKECVVSAWQGPLVAIEAHDLQYQYPLDSSGSGFCMGPVSLTVASGKIVFVVGGNGSGKSTLLKTLTGLYVPTSGTLRVNGILVQPENAAAYREMISAIHSDFHLFKKLYGCLDVAEEAIGRMLVEMKLDGKTAYRDHGFTSRELSTGQRKRLALIAALAEDRPLLVMDEWAADQDPEFRRYFYMEMLPALKARGKTVIAACHDDRYFHCADEIVTMEEGRIRPPASGESGAPLT